MATVPGFDIELLNTLGKLIGGQERYNLESAVPETFHPADLLDDSDEQTFFQIKGLADFWSHNTTVDFLQHMVDLVIGAHHQQQTDLMLIILGNPQRLAIYLSLGSARTTQAILEGIFPGIQLEAIAAPELAYRLEPHFEIQGVLTGIPSRKAFGTEGKDDKQEVNLRSTGGRQDQFQLERVIRGMHGATWAYIVQAHPRPRHKVVEERMRTIDLLSQVTTRSKVQWSSTKQESQQFTSIESGGQTESFSGEMLNYRAQYLIRLLERELERLDQAAAAGQWTVRTYFGASSTDEAKRLASLLLGTLAGADSRPEPLRASICKPQGVTLETFHTFLTSHEVAILMQLPREEVAGFAIHDHVRFDIDYHAPDNMNIPLGYIQQNGRDTFDTFNISLDALTKHAVVIGVTGSGKTTTVMNMLDRVIDAHKPFLVIEPAKTEYRALHSAFAGRAELRVYTLGNEMVAPFRLNPFEFETSDEPGSVSLLTHIDFLKAVFNAAFAMYSPLPQVLETSLHEIYEERGWDVTSGINRRLKNWQDRHIYPIFPTMTDLYNKTEEVANRLKYDPEADAHIKAALKARVGSLRIGSKGLMLDTARGIPMYELFSRPTILELEGIGNDEEKTFIMGLLLARLYEYRRLQAGTGNLTAGFQHLIVFEEAHRLLQNTSTQTNDEHANPRAQAIEVFTNMLSEIRAYGQGVLVAEQIPSKLAPDVLKNTNLKIVHRLIAQDDRQSIGQTMNLREEQQVHLGVLLPGMAAIYSEGADHAYLVRMDNYKRKITPLLDGALKQMSRTYASVKPYQAIPDIEIYGVPTAPTGGLDPAIHQAVSKLLDSERCKWLWANILLRLVSNPARVFELMLRFPEIIEAEIPYLLTDQYDIVWRALIVQGSASTLHTRGGQFGWAYEQAEELRSLLTQGLLGLLNGYQLATTTDTDEETKMQQAQGILQEAEVILDRFIDLYTTLMRNRRGPFVGCVHCPSRCLYRAEVSTLILSSDRKEIDASFANSASLEEAERYNDAADVVFNVAQSWLGEELIEVGDTTENGAGEEATDDETQNWSDQELTETADKTQSWTEAAEIDDANENEFDQELIETVDETQNQQDAQTATQNIAWEIAYCTALHTISKGDFSEYEQIRASNSLKQLFLD